MLGGLAVVAEAVSPLPGVATCPPRLAECRLPVAGSRSLQRALDISSHHNPDRPGWFQRTAAGPLDPGSFNGLLRKPGRRRNLRSLPVRTSVWQPLAKPFAAFVCPLGK